MDFHLKQPIEKQQFQEDDSDQDAQPSPAKFPRLHLELQSYPQHQQQEIALPLFAPPQPQPDFSAACLDLKPPQPRTGGGYFSTAQWEELEVQALIFRHMVAGASVPPQLLQLVKKSLLDSPCYHLNSYFQPALYHQTAGSWSKANLDPEPGRCRRTDGKKWRCSKDVVSGHKYCERHVHRGRNRSRKPVESCIPSAASRQSGLVGADVDGTQFSLSGPTSFSDIFQLNQGVSEPKPESKSLFKAQNEQSRDGESKLRLFFDDWPRSNNTSTDEGTSTVNSATCLTISTPGGNPSVDFLKLSTGNGGNEVDSMGGPLAEAFRSSAGASTTAVRHQLPQSASGPSCVTA